MLFLGSILFLTPKEVSAQKWNIFKKEEVDPKESNLEAEKYFVEAEKYYILEDYDKAYGLFLKALELQPDNAAIHFKLAQTLSKKGEIDKALGHSLQSLEYDPNNKYFYLQTAELYSRKNSYAEAADIYETLLEKIPNTEEHYFDLANLYIYQKKYSKALEAYTKAEAKFGINDQVTFQKQKLYLQQNKLEEALAEGEKLIEAYPGEAEYYLSQAEILSSNDKINEAIAYLEEALELNPNNAKARLMLSESYKKIGETDKSRDNLKLAFENPDLDLNLKVQLLLNYMKDFPNKDIEILATDLVEKLVEAHPEEGIAHAVKGDLYFRLNQQLKAKENYLTAIEKGHNNFAIWQNVIQIGLSQQQYEEVLEYSEEALELFPNQALLYLYSGTANMILKNNQEAIMVLEQGRKLATSNLNLLSTIYGQLGDAYNNLENYQESDKAYEAALDANPDNDHVLNNYSYYLSLRKENLDLARKMSTKLIKRNPNDPNYLDTHAWVLFMMGEYEQAKKVIEKAVEKNPNGTIIEHYGDILYKLGEVDQAVKQWQRAKGMDETSELIDKKIADRKLYE